MEKHDVAHLEKRINELSDSLRSLAADTDFEELIKIIHRPGWTTPAEHLFVTGGVDSMLTQAKALVGLKQVLLAGSRAVTAK
jgi:hypothetical protein